MEEKKKGKNDSPCQRATSGVKYGPPGVIVRSGAGSFCCFALIINSPGTALRRRGRRRGGGASEIFGESIRTIFTIYFTLLKNNDESTFNCIYCYRLKQFFATDVRTLK